MKRKVKLLIIALSFSQCLLAQYSYKDYFDKYFEKLDPIEGVYSCNVSWSSSAPYWEDGWSALFAIIGFGDWFLPIPIESMNDVFWDWRGEDFHIEAFETDFLANFSKQNSQCTRAYKRTGNGPNYLYQNWSDGELQYSTTFKLQSLFEFTHTVILPRKIAIQFVNMSVYKQMRVKPQIQIRETVTYTKLYPTAEMYENYAKKVVEEESKPKAWSGTGFALGTGYLVTNYHVVKEAGTIAIKGVGGDSHTSYSASVVATDKVNDIAVLRITDNRFAGFGTIAYNVPIRMAEVGEDVFVLGYPLTQTMGNEIKLTNGIISSRTGFQGDAALYQMTAPIQPGNSGGPMFDSKGNVIGIVVSHHAGAENAGYAIKTSYLKNLIESAGLNFTLPSGKNLANLSLSEKVKRVKPFVYLIECGR